MDINFSAPINMTGYGIVGGNLFYSAMEAGHSVSLWPIPSVQHIEAHPSKHKLIFKGVANQGLYNPIAPSFRHFHQFDLAQHVGRGLKIGSTVFELNRLKPNEIHHLENQDAICVPTKWANEIIIDSRINKPTLVLPHGVDRTIFHENIQPAIAKLREKNQTVFINCGKNEIRKGHDILVEAFDKAFEPSDNVQLILACYNPFYSPEENKEWYDIYKNSKMGEKVYILEGRLALQEDVAALMACADCGIFPSRAEGWGLESLEMMSMGKQVILTNYAGHTEYANEQNSLLISPGPLEDAYDGKWFHGQGQWASMGDEQIDEMVYYMRLIHKKKQEGVLKVNENGIATAKSLTWRNAVDKLVNFVEKL